MVSYIRVIFFYIKIYYYYYMITNSDHLIRLTTCYACGGLGFRCYSAAAKSYLLIGIGKPWHPKFSWKRASDTIKYRTYHQMSFILAEKGLCNGMVSRFASTAFRFEQALRIALQRMQVKLSRYFAKSLVSMILAISISKRNF